MSRPLPTLSPGRERIVLILLAAIQFTHIVDFMVLMPLGPQLMRVFTVSPGQFALLVSAYTFGAAASALVAALHIDRYDRKHVLLVIYAGFTGTTLLCAIAPTFWTLLATRVVSGVFGGIASAIVYAILGDLVPDSRRGSATGVVAMGFPLAAVAGVPGGLLIGGHLGWRATFVTIGLLATILCALAWRMLPPVRHHVTSEDPVPGGAGDRMRKVFGNRNHLNAFALIAVLMFAGFSVIPFISPYMVSNVGLSESDLPLLYLAGGSATLFTSRLFGRMADRHGKVRTFRTVAAISILPLLVTTNLPPVPVPVAMASSVLFMVFVSGRFVPLMALVNAAVDTRVRGAFLVFNSAIQQFFSGLASLAGGLILGHDAAGRMTHYWVVGLLAAGATLACMVLAGRVKPATPGTPPPAGRAIRGDRTPG